MLHDYGTFRERGDYWRYIIELIGQTYIKLHKYRSSFDYYSESSKYEFGVLNKFAKELSKLGWYCEFYDPGTVMIWEE